MIGLGLAACSHSPIDKATKVITYTNIEKHIVELSSDNYKGRMPMSDTEAMTIDYIAAQMKEIGLEPANNGSFFQDVPLLSITSVMSATLDIETPNGQLSFQKLDEYVIFSQKVEEELRIDNSEIIFAGYGITAPEYDRFDFKGIDVKGKTIVVFVNDPGYGTTDDYFKGNTMTYYGRWTCKFEEAARQGAKACFIIHETGPAGYPWAVARNNGDATNLYLEPEDGYRNRCDLEGWITRQSAEKLFDACNLSFDKAKAMANAKNFRPFALNATASAQLKSTFKTGISKNVCGVMRGSQKPEEVLVYTAHWDHLGVGTPLNSDSIYNGATDNASAVSWMLEIARAFKALPEPPQRSVLFLSVTAEESGLLGSEYYAQHPFFPMHNTVACINTDVILFLGQFNDVTLTGYRQSELDKWVDAEAQQTGRYIASDPNPENGMYFRSDQFPFVKRGVPAIFAKGYTDAKKYGKKKTLELINQYWRETYHKPQDEYDPQHDDLSGLVDDARLLFRTGYNLADTTAWPEWNDDSEFKAIRQQSRNSKKVKE